MLFLQDTELTSLLAGGEQMTPSIAVLSTDSLQQAARTLIAEAQNDPSTFWHTLFDSALSFGLKVLAALAIYLIGIWVIGRIKKLLGRVFQRRKTERTLASFLTSLVTITLTVLLIIAAIGTLGVDTSSFAALLTAGGLAIGMALSGTVQNFAGGIMLLIFHPFRAGDFIRTQGYEGRVMEVSIVSTKILTYNNMVVILPNGSLFSSTIENVFAQPIVRVTWDISVAYGVDAAACRQAMLDILLSDSRILTAKDERPAAQNRSAVNLHNAPIPDPSVVMESLNANDITFRAKAWVRHDDYWNTRHDLLERFYTELPPQGFPFAYPHMDVTLLNQQSVISNQQ